MQHRHTGTDFAQKPPNVLLPLLVAPNLRLRATRIDFSIRSAIQCAASAGAVTSPSYHRLPRLEFRARASFRGDLGDGTRP
jgi:hypothetical protein